MIRFAIIVVMGVALFAATINYSALERKTNLLTLHSKNIQSKLVEATVRADRYEELLKVIFQDQWDPSVTVTVENVAEKSDGPVMRFTFKEK